MKLRVQRVTSGAAKVKRLGYLVLLSKALLQNPLSRVSLQKTVISEMEKNRSFLKEACQHLPVKRAKSDAVVGEIKSEDAFRRYLGVSNDFGLIQSFSGRFYNTKRGEILSVYRSLPAAETALLASSESLIWQ